MKIRQVRLMGEAASDLEVGRDFYDAHGVEVGDYFFEGILSDLGELRLYGGDPSDTAQMAPTVEPKIPLCHLLRIR